VMIIMVKLIPSFYVKYSIQNNTILVIYDVM